MPRVSVVIPVYNAERFVSETIESIISQTYSSWEVVAVDDGSKDRSLEILRGFERRMPEKIRVISQKNSGVSMARNAGIGVSRGEYIAFLDQDDLWMPKKLEKQVPLLDSNRELGLVYSDAYIVWEREGRTRTAFSILKPFRGRVFERLILENFIVVSTAVVRKDAVDRVGAFNHKYRISEDYDLFLRIADQFHVDFVDEPLAKYRIHGANVTITAGVPSNDETLQIMDYWLGKAQDRTLVSLLKKTKRGLHHNKMKYCLLNHKYGAFLQEFFAYIGSFVS